MRNEEELKSANESCIAAYIRQNNIHEEYLPMSLVTDEAEPEISDEFQVFDDRDWMAISAAMPHELQLMLG